MKVQEYLEGSSLEAYGLPEVGVFTSRSPNRPNPIGLTVVELVEVKNNVLIVKGLDAPPGSPIIDIKP